jgi:hypothetical protein
MSEFYLGTVHDMQVRYYNCRDRDREIEREEKTPELQWLHSDLGDLISPAGLFLPPKLTISLKWN